MIGGSTQEKIFRDHSSTYIFVAKIHFLKGPKSRYIEITFERVSKNAFLRRRCVCLSDLQKSFVRCYHLSCVLASFLRIISKRRNRRGCHTTLQKYFTIPNVRRWQFFDCDTPKYYQIVVTTKVEKIALFRGIFEFQMAVENFLGVVTP